MNVVRCRRLWTPEGVREDAAVDLDAQGRIQAVRPASPGDGPPIAGLVVPGLVNAHAHLELSHLAGRVPGGSGFVAWVDALVGARAGPLPEAETAGRAGARRAAELGTAWLADVSNGGGTAPWLAEAGLAGVVHHERLGLDAARVPQVLDAVRAGVALHRGLVVRSSPHALFSTALEIVAACLDAGPADVPATIHVGESEDEDLFLREGRGPHADLLDRLGRDWRWWEPPGLSALQVLDLLGALGPGLLLVHAVHVDAADRALAAARGAPVVLCPRSNLHVGGRLPDAPAWLDAGVPVALGTDALASNTDLDVLGEGVALAAAFPGVDPARWLAAATHDGARAVRARGRGAIVPGAAPGLLELDAATPADVAARAPGRRWLVRPGGPRVSAAASS